jgi:alkylhydroperoxidase family enzyme
VTLIREANHPVLAELFERIGASSTGLLNIHRTLANSPEVFSAFIGLAHKLRFGTELDPAERELAILRVLARHRGHYEIRHHRRLGAAAGLTEEELDLACEARWSAGDWPERRRQVLQYADEFASGAGISAETSAGLTGILTSRQIVELSLTLSLYVGLAYFTASVDVPGD